MTTAGVERQCRCKRAQHQHGTYEAYQRDQCRCAPCRRASSRYEKRRSYRASTGQGQLVDAAPARRHLKQLLEAGVTIGQIERRTGLHRTALRVLAGDFPNRAPAARVRRDTEARLLTVTSGRLGDEAGGLVDGTGTARRVQALVANGWSMSTIGRSIGVLPANFTPIAHGRRLILVRTRQAVSELYEAWWDQTPPSTTPGQRRAATRAKRYAADHGWLPPLAWDDDLIDDPAHQPQVVEPINAGRVDRQLHAEDVEFLHDDGMRLDAIATRLGVKAKSMQRVLERQGRRDVWLAISRREELARTAPRRVA